MSDILTIAKLSRLAYKGTILHETKKFFDAAKHDINKFLLRLAENSFEGAKPIRFKDLFAFVVNKKGKTYVIVRGTASKDNWMRDIDYGRVRTRGGKAYKGFYKAALELYPLIEQEISKVEKLYFGGHSFGSAVSQILANMFHESGYNVKLAVGIGSPRVGNKKYIKNTSEFPRYEIINNLDIVGEMPPKWMQWKHYKTLYIAGDGRIYQKYNYFLRKIDRFSTLFKNKNILEYGSDHFSDEYVELLEKNKERLEELEFWNF